jgi:hypothetical protein
VDCHGQVCLNATVFVATHGGNMADFLIGERVYNGGGLSLSPHKTFLIELFGYLGVRGRTHLKELRAQARVVLRSEAESTSHARLRHGWLQRSHAS